MPLFVDCDWGRRHQDLSSRYRVRGYPTVVFTDPDGHEVERLERRDAASVAKQIEGVSNQYPGRR